MYYEADCKIERKAGETCTPYNKVTLGFDYRPSYLQVKEKLAESYSRFSLIEVTRIWDASCKAKELIEYYDKKSFTGD